MFPGSLQALSQLCTKLSRCVKGVCTVAAASVDSKAKARCVLAFCWSVVGGRCAFADVSGGSGRGKAAALGKDGCFPNWSQRRPSRSGFALASQVQRNEIMRVGFGM